MQTTDSIVIHRSYVVACCGEVWRVANPPRIVLFRPCRATLSPCTGETRRSSGAASRPQTPTAQVVSMIDVTSTQHFCFLSEHILCTRKAEEQEIYHRWTEKALVNRIANALQRTMSTDYTI